ncbi:MAG: alpha/beta hydrolase [Halobacteriaceae archaeon]
MSEPVLVSGGRDVRATLDRAADASTAVVACPPHPEHGGHRGDERLVAVADRLTDAGVDCLRIDYGPWDGGRGERADARNALDWARDRYDRVGLFGYSFGAGVALLVAADGDRPVGALAPPAALADGGVEVAGAVTDVDAPGHVTYGARDDTVDWEPVVDRARTAGWSVLELPADHFFIGQAGKVADAVVPFFERALRD